MKQLPTAEELALQIEKDANYEELINPIVFASIVAKEFAKLHVEATLEAASEKATHQHKVFDNDFKIDKNSILNSYPLTNIK